MIGYIIKLMSVALCFIYVFSSFAFVIGTSDYSLWSETARLFALLIASSCSVGVVMYIKEEKL